LVQRNQVLPLSQWLSHQSAMDGAYPLGLIWATPEERAQQVDQQRAWLAQLERLRTEGRIRANTWLSMQRMMRALAFRVGISIVLFLCILLSWKMGWLQPTGIPLKPAA
jgi:hypothetical protein